MKEFSGFPSRMQFTPVPNLFFSALLTQITDITEMKLTLHIFQLLYRKKGYPRFITYNELMSDVSLMKSLRETGKPLEEALRCAIEMATERGTILHLPMEKDGAHEDVYLLNTEANRQVMAKIRSGELVLSGLKAGAPPEVVAEEPPDVFTLYEQNIGMLTPMIAEELRDAEKQYPVPWIRDAIKEAVALNKRSWRYIAKILEHWSVEGRDDGAYRGHLKKTDPDKYIKGKYGHAVRR
ncbi:MAG: DnaD domain protein [Dehalococcoidia bacterium]|nr:DnaD domain protein [Dehalococcoidia bacterium]